MDEELDCASAATLRRLHRPDDTPARRLDAAARSADGGGERLVVHRRACEPQLEHRLHERDEVRFGRELDSAELRHGGRERDVRDVDRHDVDGLAHETAVEVGEVRPLEDDDAPVLA